MIKKEHPEKGHKKEKLINLLEELKHKELLIEEYVNDLKRLKADFENYKKQHDKERERIIALASEQLIQKLLPVIDNLERALSAGEKAKETESLLEGVALTYKILMEVLDGEGLSVMEAAGEDFDPSRHEAMMRVETDEAREDEIVEVFEKGYLLKGRVIRPAKVRVAKNTAGN